jgi:hypothetical protein
MGDPFQKKYNIYFGLHLRQYPKSQLFIEA